MSELRKLPVDGMTQNCLSRIQNVEMGSRRSESHRGVPQTEHQLAVATRARATASEAV